MTLETFKKNPKTWALTGGLVALAGAAGWFWYKKRQPSGGLCLYSDSYPLMRGSCGPNVITLQTVLKDLGADLGKSGVNKDGIDGIYGEKTEKAVLQWIGSKTFP